MLHYAIIFLVIAIIAGVLGFSGIAGVASNIAWIVFVVFLILAAVSLFRKRARGAVLSAAALCTRHCRGLARRPVRMPAWRPLLSIRSNHSRARCWRRR